MAIEDFTIISNIVKNIVCILSLCMYETRIKEVNLIVNTFHFLFQALGKYSFVDTSLLLTFQFWIKQIEKLNKKFKGAREIAQSSRCLPCMLLN